MTGALIASIGVACFRVSFANCAGRGTPSRSVCSRAAANTRPSASITARSRNDRLRLTTPRNIRSAAPRSNVPPGASKSLMSASSRSTPIKVRLSAASAPLTNRCTRISVSTRASRSARWVSQLAAPAAAMTNAATVPQIAKIMRPRFCRPGTGCIPVVVLGAGMKVRADRYRWRGRGSASTPGRIAGHSASASSAARS